MNRPPNEKAHPRSRRRREGFRRIADPLARLACEAPEPYRAASLWALCVGQEIRRHSRVVRIQQGVLEVETMEASWQGALHDLEQEILQELNRAAGRALYRRLRVLVR